MADTRGVFGLKLARILKGRGDWTPLDQVWHSPSPSEGGPETGYFAGGTPGPGSMSAVDKLTYSTDTTARIPGANLTQKRQSLAATSSTTDAYTAAGYDNSNYHSLVEKTTYASDTTARAPGADLTALKERMGAAGNITDGYFGGGRNPSSSPSNISTMDKLTYSSDTAAAVPGAALSHPRRQIAGTGNSDGSYFGGGTPGPGQISTVDKLTYASDTTAAVPGAKLSFARNALGATGNSTHGYFGGGSDGFDGLTIMDKTTYASDTTAAVPSANLISARYLLSATGNSTEGYFAGGFDPSQQSTVEKVTYSTDTTARIPGADLSSSRYSFSAASGRANGFGAAPSAPSTRFSDGSSVVALHNSGYIWGGSPSPVRSSTDRISFATDTAARVPGNFNEPRDGSTVLTSSLTAGYTSGGGPGSLSNTEKITYSTEVYTLLPSSANLYTARYELMAGGNSTQGYYVGGLTHGGSYPTHSSTDKITYSNETMNRLPSCNQPSSTFPSRKGQALSATTHGYFGGSGQPNNSSMDKMVYSVETLNLTPTAFLSPAPSLRRIRAGSSSFGYFQYVTLVEKLTYSTDTLARIPSANLAQTRNTNGGTGGPSAGYFIAGHPGPLSSMEKVNFATDTPSAIPSNLPAARYAAGAISAFDCGTEDKQPPTATPTPSTFASTPNQAVFAGAVSNSNQPSEKFLYSNETFSQIPATLTAARYGHASVSSPSAVYFGAGYGASPYPFELTIVDKYTYSNDSISRSPSSNLSDARYNLTAVGNETHGYFGGGNYQSTLKTVVERIVYSNDSESRIPGANLSYRRRELSACGNLTAGYFIGGFNPNDNPTTPERAASNVDKLTYASDTSAAVPGAFTPVGVYNHNSTGSPSVGYIGGGAKLPSSTEQQFDKLTYSTDTTAAAPGINFPSYETNYGAVSNTDVAYFTINNPAVLKLAFSSDTLSTIPATSSTTQRKVGSGARDNGIGLSPNII